MEITLRIESYSTIDYSVIESLLISNIIHVDYSEHTHDQHLDTLDIHFPLSTPIGSIYEFVSDFIDLGHPCNFVIVPDYPE